MSGRDAVIAATTGICAQMWARLRTAFHNSLRFVSLTGLLVVGVVGFMLG